MRNFSSNAIALVLGDNAITKGATNGDSVADSGVSSDTTYVYDTLRDAHFAGFKCVMFATSSDKFPHGHSVSGGVDADTFMSAAKVLYFSVCKKMGPALFAFICPYNINLYILFFFGAMVLLRYLDCRA